MTTTLGDQGRSGSPRVGAGAADLAATLERIEARLERLERTLAPMAELTAQGPALAATVGDILDEQAARLGDVERRAQSLGDTLERLTRPQTLASLRQVIDIAENAPNLVATVTDIMDETMAEAERQGLDLTHIVDDSKRLLFGLLKVTTSPELRALISSGMLDPRALESLGTVATTLIDANETEPPRVGMLGAMRALSDADTQRALGFLLRVARGFGRTLKRERKSLPSG
ncbi:MAG: DUF1641 domain-containing protein [Polyangiaceae bacterium]|nr:DUF1641 domain-containing protein [Polyangiaceae bacterium]